jgi:hypothetical protein
MLAIGLFTWTLLAFCIGMVVGFLIAFTGRY